MKIKAKQPSFWFSVLRSEIRIGIFHLKKKKMGFVNKEKLFKSGIWLLKYMKYHTLLPPVKDPKKYGDVLPKQRWRRWQKNQRLCSKKCNWIQRRGRLLEQIGCGEIKFQLSIIYLELDKYNKRNIKFGTISLRKNIPSWVTHYWIIMIVEWLPRTWWSFGLIW